MQGERLLFTREDAHSRRLLVDDAPRAAALLGARLVRKMPNTGGMPLRAQAALYAGAAAVVSPHGAASANAIFMRAGALYLELHATCPTDCARGCFPKARAGPRGELQMLGAIELPAERACELVQSVYAPFHRATGVRYHAISLCVGGTKCHAAHGGGRSSVIVGGGGSSRPGGSGRRAPQPRLPPGRGRGRALSSVAGGTVVPVQEKMPGPIKKQQSSDMHLTEALLRRLKALLDGPADGAVAESTRVAPYSLRVPCTEVVGTWNVSFGGAAAGPASSQRSQRPQRPSGALMPARAAAAERRANRTQGGRRHPPTRTAGRGVAASGGATSRCVEILGCCARHPRVAGCAPAATPKGVRRTGAAKGGGSTAHGGVRRVDFAHNLRSA